MRPVKQVIILLHEEAHLRAMLPVFDRLKQTEGFEVVAFIDQRMASFGLLGRCKAAGFSVINERDGALLTVDRLSEEFQSGSSRDADLALVARLGRFAARVQDLVFRVAVRIPLRPLASFVHRVLRRYQYTDTYFVLRTVAGTVEHIACIERVLRAHRTDLILMCEDNIEFDTAEWLLAAKRCSAGSAIIPYTIANELEFAVSIAYGKDTDRMFSRLSRVVSKVFPQWLFHYKGRDLLRAPALLALSKELAGTAPSLPWILNSGRVDTIATESEAMRSYYRRSGLPADRLVVTGSIADDRLAEGGSKRMETRRALLEKHGLPAGRKILLMAMPPDPGKLHMTRSEFMDSLDVVRYWGEIAASIENWNVVIRPHPKTRAEELEPLRGLPITIDWGDTDTLVPACDAYVACVSATIRWAVACGIPVINYDIYRYDYIDYLGLEGVVHVRTKDEFNTAVRRITKDDSYREFLAEHQRRAAPEWGCLDGRSGQRIVELIERVAS
jgi:hypothetical protein